MNTDFSERIREDIEAHLGGNNQTLVQEMQRRSRVLAPTQGAHSGAAIIAGRDAAADDLDLRIVYVGGFKLTEQEGISQGVFAPPPQGLQVADRGDHIDFVVGTAN